MSEAKFTKGPWKLSENRDSYLIASENTGFSICYTTLSEDVDKYNANLMAAAPEMYEFLDIFVKLVEDDSSEDFLYKFNDIKLLLAKARGEKND
ncbi:hypothetical protein NVP1278O_70 [Vibrio phage 1.278.O._10N.286.54.E8]|nr:hypothetical protein NVP1278O_70 [Vibrio phage 1.278.O._10N.286.54.E8]